MDIELYAHDDVKCSFTVIPYSVVTDKIELELRASVESRSSHTKEICIDFYLDEYDDMTKISSSGIVNLAHGEKFLYRDFFPTRGLSGDHKMVATVRLDGMPAGAQYTPIKIVPCETMALPFMQTAWLEPYSYLAETITEQDARDYLHSLKNVGIDGCIIVCTESIHTNSGAFYDSNLPEFAKFDPPKFNYVQAILDEAEKLGMHIFIGLGRGDDLWLLWTGLYDNDRIEKQLDFGRRLSAELWEKYGHYQSFYGWYIAHETDDIDNANRYYNPMTDILHGYCLDKPVMIAPSPGCVIPDAECEEARRVVNEAHYDIIAYQDAVGAGTHPFGNTWNQELRIKNLHKYYKRNLKSHEGTKKHIWTDLEIWKMDGPTYANSYAAQWSQVARQIEIERNYVEHISIYAMPSLFQDKNAQYTFKTNNIELATKLYEEYREYYEKAKTAYNL